jgi:hypothetical protein
MMVLVMLLLLLLVVAVVVVVVSIPAMHAIGRTSAHWVLGRTGLSTSLLGRVHDA